MTKPRLTPEQRIVEAARKFIRRYCPDPGMAALAQYYTDLGKRCAEVAAAPDAAAVKAVRSHLGIVSRDYKKMTALLARELAVHEALTEIAEIARDLDSSEPASHGDAVKRIANNLVVFAAKYSPAARPNDNARQEIYKEITAVAV